MDRVKLNGTHDDTTMPAVLMRDFGAPDVLAVEHVRRPQAAPGEVRIKVEAVVVNNTRDVATRTGRHPFSRSVTLPHILGGEHAGEVDAVGDGVEPSWIGRRVAVAAAIPCGRCAFCRAGHDEACVQSEAIGIHRSGAYAAYTTVPITNVLPIPEGMSSVDAAVLLTTGPVGLAQLSTAELGAGDVLIVPGVAGALGSMVAALAVHRGARVVGIERDLTQATTLQLPVDAVLDSAADDLEQQLRDACGDSGAHAVIDNLGLPHIWSACSAVLAPRGRIVISGAVGDGTVVVDVRQLYIKNQSIIGMRTGNRQAVKDFWRDVSDGFRLPEGLVQTFPLADAADVHRLVEAGSKVGHYALLTGQSLS